MSYCKHFCLIDRAGIKRYPSLSDGKFTIGKSRLEPLADLRRFASAVLKEGKAGRFESTCGKKGTLVYSGSSRAAVGYILDSVIAAQIGLPCSGCR